LNLEPQLARQALYQLSHSGSPKSADWDNSYKSNTRTCLVLQPTRCGTSLNLGVLIYAMEMTAAVPFLELPKALNQLISVKHLGSALWVCWIKKKNHTDMFYHCHFRGHSALLQVTPTFVQSTCTAVSRFPPQRAQKLKHTPAC
jgi:hypothetical protein